MSRNKRFHKYRAGTTVNRFLNSARSSSQHSTIAAGGPIGRDRAYEASPPIAATPAASPSLIDSRGQTARSDRLP
jgi:hypothetical protein